MAKKRIRHEPDKISAALQALLETQPAVEPSLLDQVARHLELIEKLRAHGHSYGRIAEALQQVGMEISTNTLRLYVGRLRRKATGVSPKQARPRQEAVEAVKDRIRVRQPAMNSDVVPAIDPEASTKVSTVAAWLTDEPDERNI